MSWLALWVACIWRVALIISAAASFLSTFFALHLQLGPSGFGLAGRAVKLYSLSRVSASVGPNPVGLDTVLGYSLLAVSGGHSS